MKGKIAFEEHFSLPETLEGARDFAGDSGKWEFFSKQILDLDNERIERMDKTGIEFALLSLNAPALQRVLDANEAMYLAKKANDRMAKAVSDHPTRYAALAALPMHDPDAASRELTRCVKEMGFKGILVNGFQQVGTPDNCKYYDTPEYRSFWATVSELDVPFYLHPRMQTPSQAKNDDGHPWLMSAPWGFAVETSIHSLRLCGSGLFDDYPNLRICIGHLGEMIPFGLWRIDARMRFSPRGYRGNNPLGYYFKKHFHITTSGNFNDPAFRCTLDTIDHDKIYFCADYPFEQMEDAADWYDNSQVITEAQRLQIGRTNAINLFKLDMK